MKIRQRKSYYIPRTVIRERMARGIVLIDAITGEVYSKENPLRLLDRDYVTSQSDSPPDKPDGLR